MARGLVAGARSSSPRCVPRCRPAMTSLSKAEYLKKYLSAPSGGGDYEDGGGKEKKKKRKRDKHSKHSSGVRIIDDDAMARGGDREIYSEDDEEKPQIDGGTAADLPRSRKPPAKARTARLAGPFASSPWWRRTCAPRLARSVTAAPWRPP